MLKRILVATDFSLAANLAWQFALDLACTHNATLTLLHVGMPRPEAAPQTILRDHERVLRGAQRRVDERIRHAPARSISAGGLVVAGEPVTVIAHTAATTEADLIVVGSHESRGHLEAVVVGSVAERLIRVAPCPVVVVRRSARYAA